MIFDGQVRNLIWKVVNAFDRCRIIPSCLHHAFEGCPRHNRLTYQPRPPTDRVTASVDTPDNGMEKRRAIPTALHVVLACPHYFHWMSRSLGHMNSFHHEVRLRCCSTTESSA